MEMEEELTGDSLATKVLLRASVKSFQETLENVLTKDKINARNGDTTTVLMVAAATDKHEAVKILLENGANPHKRYEYII